MEETDGLALRLQASLESLMGMLRRHRPPSDWIDEKLTMPQFKALVLVTRDEGAQAIGDLARGMHLSAPTVTGIVDRLHEAGLVKRRRASEDRRVVEVVATTKGRELIARVFTLRNEHLRHIIGLMDRADAEALLQGLEGLKKAIMKEMSTSD